MLPKTITYLSVLFVALIALTSAHAEGFKLDGSYSPEETHEYFQLIGEAKLGTDVSGNVLMIFGSIEIEGGTTVDYEVLFSMCNELDTRCGNVRIRHDWHASRTDIWCIIQAWDDTGEYDNKARAGFAFDKIRLIREQFGFGSASGQSAWLFVQLWRHELLQFHALTEQDSEVCT